VTVTFTHSLQGADGASGKLANTAVIARLPTASFDDVVALLVGVGGGAAFMTAL
jgi:hypothetical protein